MKRPNYKPLIRQLRDDNYVLRANLKMASRKWVAADRTKAKLSKRIEELEEHIQRFQPLKPYAKN